MDRNDVEWKGYWAATPTPFTKEGKLDETAWREGLRLYLRDGLHGVLVNGTTGEWFSQSEQERKRVAEIAVEELGGKIPVVIGCTTFTPQNTIELARHALSIKADGVMSTPPPYCAPVPREIVAYFRALSDHVSIPIMVYNWARGTHVEITRDVALDLAKIKNVVCLKDSTIHKAQMLETLEAVGDKLRVFSGFVSRLGIAVLNGLGGDGNIDGGAVIAREGVAFYEALWRKDEAAAKKAADRYVPFMRRLIKPDWSGMFGSPQPQLKATMNILGQPGGYPRLPLLPIEDAESLAAIRSILTDAGLLSSTAAAA